MEKSEFISDVEVEKKRLASEEPVDMGNDKGAEKVENKDNKDKVEE